MAVSHRERDRYMSMAELTAIFGWMTVINLAFYFWAAAFIVLGRDWVSRLQARIMGVPAEKWPDYYVDYLSRYKIGITMFNLAPYLALKIVF
jgi:hypothetical protein